MDQLSTRQKNILTAIVEQYAEVAAPVGSVTLAKLFGVSSATVRADMYVLEDKGYISQPHTSAGRTPTDKGYRSYVNGLTEVKTNKGDTPEPSPRGAQALSSRIQSAGDPDKAIRSAVKTLVELTHNVGLATIGGSTYVRGFANLFAQPELTDPRMAHQVASLLDNLDPWLREVAPNKPLSVYIGRENPIGKNSGCSLIISKFNSPYSERSYIGVLGPTRQNYREVMKLVKKTGELLEEAVV